MSKRRPIKRERVPQPKPVTVDDDVEVGHYHMRQRDLAPELHERFPQGACVVFVNGDYAMAFPARYADVTELAVLLLRKEAEKYNALRTQVCKGVDFRIYASDFKVAMDKLRARELAAKRAATEQAVKDRLDHIAEKSHERRASQPASDVSGGEGLQPTGTDGEDKRPTALASAARRGNTGHAAGGSGSGLG